MSGFAQKLREAQVSGGDLADFLKANNVAIKDAAGNLLPVQQIFGKIVELIGQSNNEMDKLAALSKLGFSADWLRLFERQTDAVRAFATSTESAQDAVMRRGMADGEALSAAWSGVWSDIKSTALSASVSILSSIGEIEHRGAAEFSHLADQAKAAFDRMTGDAKGAARAIEAAFASQKSELMRREALDVAGGKSPFGTLNPDAFGPRPAAKPASDQPTIKGLYDDNSPDGGKSDNQAQQAEIKAIEDKIAAARTAEKAQEQLYAEGAKIGILSAEQKLAASKSALDQEYNAEKGLLQKELQIDGLKLAQKQAINDKLKALDVKYAADSQKLFMQSVESQIKTWDNMVNSISNSLSSGIMGMIKGTETFRQAMLHVAGGITQQFVKMGVDIVANWAKAQIAQVVLSQSAEGQKTAAALAGASARAGAASGEAMSGIAAIVGNAVKSITIDSSASPAPARPPSWRRSSARRQSPRALRSRARSCQWPLSTSAPGRSTRIRSPWSTATKWSCPPPKPALSARCCRARPTAAAGGRRRDGQRGRHPCPFERQRARRGLGQELALQQFASDHEGDESGREERRSFGASPLGDDIAHG